MLFLNLIPFSQKCAVKVTTCRYFPIQKRVYTAHSPEKGLLARLAFGQGLGTYPVNSFLHWYKTFYK